MTQNIDSEVAGNTRPPLKKTERFREWFLTINNYNEDDIDKVENCGCRYWAYQKEVGKECGTPHIHAYLYFTNQRTWSSIKKQFKTAHIELVMNTDACIEYCMKADTRVEGPWESGKRPAQGKRSDLEEVVTMVKEGKKMKDIAMECPMQYIKFNKGIDKLNAMINLKPRKDKPSVIWYHGLAGVGKTRTVFDEYDFEDIYVKDHTMWWDGYSQEKVILIDDFDGKWPFRDLLRLLDRYPYQGQYKGGYVHINSNIVITCEFPPSNFWIKGTNEYDQVARRLDSIIEITRVASPP